MRMNASLIRSAFTSLAVSNYRRYFGGQAVSQSGTWMQTVAQSWLVLQLSGSGTAVGGAVALQALPILIFAPYGGLVADRVDKRRLMITFECLSGTYALTLGLLVVTDAVRLWQVYLLAALLGVNKAFESPSRQAFVLELVGRRELRNAVTLNSVLGSVARAVGSALAGLIIAASGTGVCFLINSFSFVAVVASLVRIDTTGLHPAEPVKRAKGQLREGLRYAAGTPRLAVPLTMMALVGCLAYQTQVVLPVLAERTFDGNGATYGFMTAAMGTGAVVGGLAVAARGRSGTGALVKTTLVFGAVIGLTAVSPTLPAIYLCLALLGGASVAFRSIANSTLQLAADPGMRGRVMGLFALALLGTAPIGGPIAGAVSDHLGPRWGLGIGAVACAVAGLGGLLWALRRTIRPAPDARDPVSPG